MYLVTTTAAPGDTPALRKARGAFFTPEPVARFIAEWAVRGQGDLVFEPSTGDAIFLTAAAAELRRRGANRPILAGAEIHPASATTAADRVRAAGGQPRILVGDFFSVPAAPMHDAVIGNPPWVRYQGWTGEARTRSKAAALRHGVRLTNLASSWAAFAVRSVDFLRPGGRLGLVLPAELLSVNYAGPVREFLFRSFRQVDLVLFEERVFAEAEADSVLLLADGYGEGPTDHARIFQTRDGHSLRTLSTPSTWAPVDPAAKWSDAVVDSAGGGELARLLDAGWLSPLERWGDTTLGAVTGANDFFALSPAKVRDLGLKRSDVVRLSPPGSSHLRGLDLNRHSMTRLGRGGRATWLFRPAAEPSAAAWRYISHGEQLGVDEAYKCRIRREWWRVPIIAPPDLFLTYMNADTVRMTTNEVRARHLNSVHGVYLPSGTQEVGRELLPLASLNSATLLSAELAGRSYGGGILKMEPREADGWLVPAYEAVSAVRDHLRDLRPTVSHLLRRGQLLDAVAAVDQVVLPGADTQVLRDARTHLHVRRAARGRSRGL